MARKGTHGQRLGRQQKVHRLGHVGGVDGVVVRVGLVVVGLHVAAELEEGGLVDLEVPQQAPLLRACVRSRARCRARPFTDSP